MTITKFTIFSERNSGSNYLRQLISANLKLKYTSDYGFKHWWLKDVPDRPEMNDTTDNEIKYSWKEHSSEVLFIILVRNPFDWLKSMYLRPHHLKKELKFDTFQEFLEIPWICEETEKMNPNWTDLRIGKNQTYFIEEASDIFEIRRSKYKHWMNYFLS